MQITKAAVEEFKKMVKESDEKDAGVRLIASNSCCCGTSFSMEVTAKAEAGDKTVTMDGIKIFVSSAAQDKLSGSTIDYSDAGGFSIKGTSSSCCG